MVALLAGCASGTTVGGGPSSPGSGAAASASTAATFGSTSPTFDPAASADVLLPTGSRAPASAAVTLVVLVPGGGWVSHDRTGFAPLARTLADAGYAVVSTEYRALQDGVRFPDTLQDVECSAAYAAAQVRDAGYTAAHVVLVGHSAGGHLAALAAVSGGALAAPCADRVPHLDGVVGLAGVYDVRAFAFAMQDWFGASPLDAPQLWDSGDPLHYVETGTAPHDLRVLLLHGDDDVVVPVGQSKGFAAALTSGGYHVDLAVLAGQTHMTVITPAVAGPPILHWLAAQGW